MDFAAAELFDRLRSVAGADGRAQAESTVAGTEALAEAVEQYQVAFDRRHGGFGESPKFPRPSELLFLLREHARTGAQPPLMMATETLRAMALGGMRDHVGGGFHRYSVDARVAGAALRKDALRPGAAGRSPTSRRARRSGERVLRGGGGRHAGLRRARSARSGRRLLFGRRRRQRASCAAGPKKEGAFYVWSDDEIAALLGADADIVRQRFGIEPGGNAPQDPQGEFTGQNLLYTARTVEDVAAATGRTADEVVAALGRARQILFDARAQTSAASPATTRS